MAPRILLVEDDPITRAYLVAALEALPATVVAVDTVAAARTAALNDDHALWMIDANLPDGDGAGLLAELRAAGRAATPAIAHTATQELATLQSLVDAGFIEALAKPLTAATLHDAVRRVLRGAATHVADGERAVWGEDQDRGARDAPQAPHALDAPSASTPVASPADAWIASMTGSAPSPALPTWDDAVALKALGGERSHVDALRALFTGELTATRQAVVDAARRGDVTALNATLHRLRASCGFVGATRLAAAVAALHASPESAHALADFEAACADATPNDHAGAGTP